MESIWTKNVHLENEAELKEDLYTDTVIIGAGMTGILTAYLLKQRGVDTVILEAKTIGSGQTRNTTAKITSQHGLFYDDLIKKVGYTRAFEYAKVNQEAIHIFEQIIRKEKIDCDFIKLPSYLYTQKEENIIKLKNEAEAAKKLGINAKYVESEGITELPFKVLGAVRFYSQAQFHPLKFLKHLSKELVIYENTKVIKVKGHTIYTQNKKIQAKNIVFACHYPIINVPGFYFLRQHQERSYVMALAYDKELDGMYYGVDENSLSLRSYGNILLLGGGKHRTGKGICQCKEIEKNQYGYLFLRNMKAEYYKDFSEICHFAAQDCISHDKIPLIGKYSFFRPYWYVATGFKKWGMTTSMVSAMILSGKIEGNRCYYEKVFSPQRLLVRAGIKDFIIDLFESVKGLLKGLFSRKDRTCPHMGCRLEWNNEEDSYDCPCHGSRFDKNGELLDNPAKKDIVI